MKVDGASNGARNKNTLLSKYLYRKTLYPIELTLLFVDQTTA